MFMYSTLETWNIAINRLMQYTRQIVKLLQLYGRKKKPSVLVSFFLLDSLTNVVISSISSIP